VALQLVARQERDDDGGEAQHEQAPDGAARQVQGGGAGVGLGGRRRAGPPREVVREDQHDHQLQLGGRGQPQQQARPGRPDDQEGHQGADAAGGPAQGVAQGRLLAEVASPPRGGGRGRRRRHFRRRHPRGRARGRGRGQPPAEAFEFVHLDRGQGDLDGVSRAQADQAAVRPVVADPIDAGQLRAVVAAGGGGGAERLEEDQKLIVGGHEPRAAGDAAGGAASLEEGAHGAERDALIRQELLDVGAEADHLTDSSRTRRKCEGRSARAHSGSGRPLVSGHHQMISTPAT
jgi:hypothetical protein